ncbi:ABC transporter substrate-binding protein [Marinomonas colpomeniae]|uniref:Iron-siderophore ABC transporter substrate-binding protein n=1 Tax=Marinomonas colpomeniae TaxID=2774408 RepID=A0ABR8NW30_9GAMM|nr:iron-siderophore ABC transporter substrate-binding protein [Marinomonas colpomeniae]MBD5770113.1 iron-siderophore ABC transporter substrate-binding protein [Marinomonas colpomeniae]
MSFARNVYRMIFVCFGLAGGLSAYASDISINTQYGKVSVPHEVKRIVTVYEGALDSSFALGFEPVGAISTRGGDKVASYIQVTAKNVPLVGSMKEINIEAVIAQRPDVILAPWYLPKEQYALLSRIAPTIVPENKGFRPDAWINELRFYAKALNREQKAEEVIQQVNDRITLLKKEVESNLPEDERGASLIRWMPQGAVVLTPKFFSNAILAQTGFDVTDAGLVEKNRPHSSVLSLENLSTIDNDWLFMATLNSEARDALSAAQKTPVFARLSVAKKDHVIPVDGQLWTSATGPIAANGILDDIQNVIDSKLK